jgi:hypothetical protein
MEEERKARNKRRGTREEEQEKRRKRTGTKR